MKPIPTPDPEEGCSSDNSKVDYLDPPICFHYGPTRNQRSDAEPPAWKRLLRKVAELFTLKHPRERPTPKPEEAHHNAEVEYLDPPAHILKIEKQEDAHKAPGKESPTKK